MLVLSRKRFESIVLNGGAIEVKVMRIKGSTVKLGIKAPGLRVLRGEVEESESLEFSTGGNGYLVLSRYADETIKIGATVVVTVKEVRSNRVVLGTEAPQEMSISRAA